MEAPSTDTVSHAPPTIDECEAVIGDPKWEWIGRCHEVSNTLNKAHPEWAAQLRYGWWLGPVHPHCLMFHGKPVVRHGWLELPDGSIVDLTRWVFEAVEPYLYHGPNDHYDIGGDLFRQMNEKPPPAFQPHAPSARVEALVLPVEPAIFVMSMLAPRPEKLEYMGQVRLLTTLAERFWLANLSRATLGAHAADIYLALVAVGDKALIPIDNYEYVTYGLGEGDIDE